MKHRFLPQEALKLLACLTMLIDHVGLLFFPQALWMRLVGRISFPLFCFLLTQAMRHTRSRPKYLLRLAVLTLLSELPYDFALYGGFTWEKQSVMVTLFFGACMCLIMQFLVKLFQKPINCLGKHSRILSRFLTAAIMLLAFFPFYYGIGILGSSYGWKGIFIIALFMIAWELPFKELWCVAGLLGLYWYFGGSDVSFMGLSFPFQLPGMLVMVPICLYSGKKALSTKAFDRSFSLFYPAHLLILAFLL